MVRATIECHIAAFGNEQRVVGGLGMVREKSAHLGSGLEVELVIFKLEPRFVEKRRPRLDAQQCSVGGVVVVVHVMEVVGQHQRKIKLFGKSQQVVNPTSLNPDSVIHDFDEVVFFPKDVAHNRRSLFGFLVLTETNSSLNFPTHAAACRNQALCVLRKNLVVHSRVRVETFDVRRR